MKNYVLDTNVLIENPRSIYSLQNGEQNQVHIPYTVLLELDRLKKDSRLGHVVGQAIQILLDDSSLRLFKASQNGAYNGEPNDDLLLKEIIEQGIEDPILVTNDRILQVKAKLYGIRCEGYRDANPFQSESQRYTGFVGEGEEPIPNCFQWLEGKPVYHGSNGPRVIDYAHRVWGVNPRTVYQNLAMELVNDPGIDLVSIQSEAGYGKTFIALACALYQVLEQKESPFRKVYLVKPVVEIGSKMGYLPGDVEDKMQPYIRYVFDLVFKLHELRPANRIFLDPELATMRFNPKKFEILPIAYIRGMNLENAVVIVDEMQNMSRTETRSLLTRMGEGVKCVCLGDTRQVDSPYLNESNNGLNWVVKKLKGSRNYAHIVLKGERSRGPITDMVLKSGL